MRYSRRWPALAALALAALGSACSGSTGPEAGTSRVEGRVLRGPVQPVCREGAPCDAPFSAGFHVRRQGRTVAGFRSDSAGRFALELHAGAYEVVPDADAPLISPTQQVQPLVVGADSVTRVELLFDTGIR